MALNVYTREEDIPSGMILVSDNDSYFSGETLLSGSDFCKLVLKNIDKAEYISEFCFIGRTKELGNLNVLFPYYKVSFYLRWNYDTTVYRKSKRW